MNGPARARKTKAELHAMEARIKSWMLATAISIITVTSAIDFALYTALKT